MVDHQVFSSCTISNSNCHCFDVLTDEERKLIEENKVSISYKKGEIICKQGSFASHIMYLCDGLVKIFLESNKDSLILKILPKGNLIGLTSLMENNNIFQYSAVAYQDSKVESIDINIFRQILMQNPDFAFKVISILSENAVQTYGRFFSLVHKQSYGRMADILLCLAKRVFKQDEFDLDISRKEIAELTGLAAESVTRILKKFKEEELISIEGKKFKILDYPTLQHLSSRG